MSRQPASGSPKGRERTSSSEALSPLAQLGFALADVTRLARHLYDVRLSAEGLSGASWRVLAYLYREDGLTQTELADLLEVSRAATGQMIDRLEQVRLVERRSDPKDRRSWRVHLSKKAHDSLGRFLAVSREIESECFGIFSEKELETFAHAIARLRAHLLRLQSDGAGVEPDEGEG